MARIHKILPIVLSGLAYSTPRGASACHDVTLCLNWQANVNDDGFGEPSFVGDKVRASGARIMLIRPSPEPPLSGFLGQDGCMTFKTQFAYGHKVVVYAEAWVGTRPGGP